MLKIFKKIDEYFRIKWCEQVKYDWKMVDEIIEFFNVYYDFKEHPIKRKDAFMIGGYDKSNNWLSLSLDAILWKTIPHETEEQIRYFYRFTPFEFLSNYFKSHSNMTSKVYNYIRDEIKKRNAKKILDYGCGSGYIALKLAQEGYNVTCAEISHIAVCWLKHISKIKNINIKVIDLFKENIIEHYDFIICKDVIEHVKNPKELLELLGKHGDFTLVTPDECSGSNDREPMHFMIKFDYK